MKSLNKLLDRLGLDGEQKTIVVSTMATIVFLCAAVTAADPGNATKGWLHVRDIGRAAVVMDPVTGSCFLKSGDSFIPLKECK